MQFYSTGHDPTPEALLVCRDARWKSPLIAVVFWGFYGLLAYAANDCPLWIQRGWAAICLFVTLLAWSDWRLKSRPDSWMLALNRTGLWLNLRDIAYHEAPPGETVVFLPHEEIEWARRYTHKYKDAKRVSWSDDYLEVLTTPDHGLDIEIALEEDRKRKPPAKGCLGGFIQSVPQPIGRQPVSVPDEGRLRIATGTKNYGMQPPVWTVLERLSEFVPIAEPAVRQDTDELELSDEQYEARAAELAAAGEKMAAVRLLTRRGGLSMTDAVARYKELAEAAASVQRRRLKRPPAD